MGATAMATDDERRKHARAEISMVAVVLARHNPGVAMTIDSLSLGGARLSGPATFARDERVQVLFDIEGTPLDIAAEVVRVEHQDIVIDRIAVRFVSLTQPQRAAIRHLVQRVLELEDEITPSADA
jgi:hypothetical protein